MAGCGQSAAVALAAAWGYLIAVIGLAVALLAIFMR